MADELGRLECYQSVTKSVVLILLSLLMTGAAYYCTGHSQIHIVVTGWVGFVFFGVFTILRTYHLFNRGPVVIIDEVGIEDSRSGIGIIPWEEICAIRVMRIRRANFMCIETTDEDKLLSIIPWFRKLWLKFNGLCFGISPIYIHLTGLSHGLDEVFDFISDRNYLTPVDNDESGADELVLVNTRHSHEISG